LRLCSADSDDCGAGLACQCGVCTHSCRKADECAALPDAALPDAVCVAFDEAEQCSTPVAQPHCDTRCDSNVDCAAVSAAHVCAHGVCGTPGPVIEPAAASPDASAAASPDASAAAVCSPSGVPGNALVMLGDSFLAVGHQVVAYLESQARAAGVLSESERYRDNSLPTANALAIVSPGIAEQYVSAQAESPVQVVVMNGGGADLLVGTCDTVGPDCPVIANAATAASALFEQMAADGVSAVVYAFYPDPVDDSVRAKIDALRPLIQSACVSSPVACYWLDLRDTFAGHSAEYLAANGLDPSSPGAKATANAIWGVMQANCIAQ
jgi:hypothetical protein